VTRNSSLLGKVPIYWW